MTCRVLTLAYNRLFDIVVMNYKSFTEKTLDLDALTLKLKLHIQIHGSLIKNNL